MVGKFNFYGWKRMLTKYRILTTTLVAGGLLTACVGQNNTAGGITATGTTLNATGVQSAPLFQTNPAIIGAVSFDNADNSSVDTKIYYSKVSFTLTNNGTSPIDLSTVSLSLNAQSKKAHAAIKITNTDSWGLGGVGVNLSFTQGNGTIINGKLTPSGGSVILLQPGKTITFNTGIDTPDGDGINQTLAIETFAINGQAPVPSPVPSPSTSPIPSPSPSPSTSPTAVPTSEPTTIPPSNVIVYPEKIGTYTGGTQVLAADGKIYECISNTVAPWCNQNNWAYIPGKGEYYTQAWKLADGPTPPPVTTGELDVVVDTTATCPVGSSNCQNLKIVVSDSTGNPVQSFTVPNANLGAKYTQPITGLLVNSTYKVSAATLPNALITYNPADADATIIANQPSYVTVTYSPDKAIVTGSANITLPSVLPAYTNPINVIVRNTVNGQVMYSQNTTQGNTLNIPSLPISDSTHQYAVELATGIADPVAGKYYKVIGSPVLNIVKDKPTAYTIPLVATNLPLNKLNLVVSGLENSDTVTGQLADANATYSYVQPTAKSGNTTITYLVESGLNVRTLLTASGNTNYQQNPIAYSGVVNTTTNYSVVFAKQKVSAITYDYKVWFKDYNNKFDISLIGVKTAKSLVLTSNAKLASSLWGTCFGQTLTNEMAKTTQNADGSYNITLTTTNGDFDFSKQCTLMYDDKTSEVLPGSGGAAHNLIITGVKVDGNIATMNQPCAATGCKDPGNGYVNAGYYAQWAVWGRSYNPNNMPFDAINDIIYAFIGFNPDTGDLKTLDSAADSWGLAATTRALLQYPYMHAHLSFGGWTNNAVNTAPMFQKLSSNPTSMQNFAKQAVALMKKNKFTGLDIDWEWWSDYKNNEAPAKQMLAFYKILRTELDAAGKADGKHYTLTIAVNAGVDRVTAMQDTKANPNAVADFWKQVNSLVDNVNLMTYDYHGAYDQDAAYFHANYDFANVPSEKQAAVGQTSGWSAKAVIAAYINSGVDAKKLVVGLPIYARTMKVTNNTDGGLLQPILGAGFGDYENGILDYKCLINPVADPVNGCGVNIAPKDVVFYNSTSSGAQLEAFNKYGLEALQPWAYSPSTNSFITYDDAWSVKAKAQKVIAQKLGGTMFWELDGDSTDPTKSLVRATANSYNGK